MNAPRKYAEVKDVLERSIRAGGMRPGDWVRVREVADDHGVAINTAAEALRLLEADGYLMRIEGQTGYEVARHEYWRTSPKAALVGATSPACGAALTAGTHALGRVRPPVSTRGV
jgi:DNA-binding transcriptional regulator YhcF (GntR family)